MNTLVKPGVYGLAPLPSPAEFADRVRRLQTEMEGEDLDAVVLTSWDNFEYFNSHRSMAWTYHARPMFLVVGRSRTVIVAPQMEESAIAGAETHSESVFYAGFLPEAAEAIVSVCQSLAASPTKIGIDYGYELGGKGSLTLIEGLSRLGTVVEAGKAIWNVREIKSQFELKMMRVTFDIANRAFDDVIKSAKVGMTEAEMCRALQVELLQNGADRVDPFSVLFGKSGLFYGRPSSDRRLAVDDYVWTDFRSRYGSYPADINRTARVGAPSQTERDTYTAVREVTIGVCEGMRPGWTGAEAYALFVDLWNGAGLPKKFWSASGAGRIGHGGGCGLTEPPSIGPQSNEVLNAGMVIHIEPKIETEYGMYQCEQVVFMGENGNEFLAALPPEELPVIEP